VDLERVLMDCILYFAFNVDFHVLCILATTMCVTAPSWPRQKESAWILLFIMLNFCSREASMADVLS
jgi:hypothetical protein